MKNIAVILAGGSGTRSGFDRPKQMVKLAGKPIIAHTIKSFNSSPLIDEIAIMVSGEIYDQIVLLVNDEKFHKVKKVLNGGKERWESSWSAIKAYEEEAKKFEINLIFHDAVRPLVDDVIIENVHRALKNADAVDVVINTVDTIVQADESGRTIEKILDRSVLKNGQTPQAFKYSVIKEAYDLALKDKNFKVTDDCGVVKKYLPHVPIQLVPGSSFNLKLTYNEDLAMLDKLFQFRKEISKIDKCDKEVVSLLKSQQEKVFVVFGGTRGIGEDMVSILKEYGHKVYALSRKTSCDISKIEDVQKALADIYEKEKRIDYVVNTSALLIKQPLDSMKYEDILSLINTNYLGTVNIAYASFKYLEETRGSLLLFTSSSYTYGRAFYSLYSSSKAAIVNFTQAIADEWNRSGVRVNCVNPERTLTPMRLEAFGVEDPATLLNSRDVAVASLKTIMRAESGLIVDVKRA